MAKTSHTFVLVHGAWWAGDWWWTDVAEPLQAAGHKVHTPCLTGLGYRAHLAGCGYNLTTHIDDIANFILWEGLTDIILVGHSYGGMVISGVAERLPEGTICSIVYLDAFFPREGESLADLSGPNLGVLGEDDPVPPPIFFAGGDKELEKLLIKGGKPQARACFFEKARLTGARDRIPIKTYVLASGTANVLGANADRLRADSSWRVEDLDCGHFTMFDRPAETVEILLRAVE